MVNGEMLIGNRSLKLGHDDVVPIVAMSGKYNGRDDMTPNEIKQAIHESFGASAAAMNTGDSKAIARFVRLSTMQLKLIGGVSAALCLEMIARLRCLESLLAEVYKQAGNAAPPERRHALTPGLRDSIRSIVYPDFKLPDHG